VYETIVLCYCKLLDCSRAAEWYLTFMNKRRADGSFSGINSLISLLLDGSEVFIENGRFELAEKYYLGVIDMLDEFIQIYNDTILKNNEFFAGWFYTAADYRELPILCRNFKDFHRAKTYYNRILDFKWKWHPEYELRKASVFIKIIDVCNEIGEEQQIDYWKQKASEFKNRCRETCEDHDYANVCYDMNDFPEALKYYRKSLTTELRKKKIAFLWFSDDFLHRLYERIIDVCQKLGLDKQAKNWERKAQEFRYK